MQYKNIEIVEVISSNYNAYSYGRNKLIVVCKTLIIGNPNIRNNVKP